ncbi:MAG: Holliday junction resolvase-like protein [Solirubrobacterales bacterium]
MSEPALTAIAVLSSVAAIWLAISYARYRVAFRYDEADLRTARTDAAGRSRAVRGGRAVEQMAPLLAPFAERFDSADARFLGAPVDYVVFDGLAAGELREVVLVEVKTGGGKLNANERRVREAVAEGRVSYELIRLDWAAAATSIRWPLHRS